MEIQNNFIQINTTWNSQEVNEGDGVRLRRIVGIKKMDYIDPFLMLDHIESIKLPSGFPDHPHRGFETVTYSLQGSFYHEDFAGHKGELGPGDVQWMTAGKGIVHSEMPASKTEKASGFQLWINLSSRHKMVDPYYQEIKNEKIPKYKNKNVEIFIIAGKYEGIEGPCKSISSNISYFDIQIESNSTILFPIEAEMHGFLYVFEGDYLIVDKTIIEVFQAGTFESNKINILKFTAGKVKTRFLLIFGKKLNEKIARYGPFVMNTFEEIEQAFEDYQNCKNGFEKRKTWKSENHLLKYK
jgi:redox-sensitive bicupin YhaK (pirin superfamily)